MLFLKVKIYGSVRYFSPHNSVLKKFLLRCLSLEDLSYYLEEGSYEFMSRVRVGYVFDRGGVADDITNYEEGIQMIYGTSGKTRRVSRRITSYKTWIPLTMTIHKLINGSISVCEASPKSIR